MVSRRALIKLMMRTVPALGLAAGSFVNPGFSQSFPDISFAAWDDLEPDYLFYPGDQIELTFPGAPELNRSLIIAPDGRISLPMIGQVMAAFQSLEGLQATLRQAYRPYLRNPGVELSLKQATAMRVLVGGEVRNGGWVDMGADMDALQAVLAAGGFLPSARTQQAVLIRRSLNGRPMRRTLDLKAALRGTGELVALRRFDVLFVPRSTIAEANLFMQQYVRDLLPFGLSYSLNGRYQ